MGTLIEKWFGFSQIREELEARIGELEDENAELFTTKEKLKRENTELASQNAVLTEKTADLKTEN